MKQSSDHYPASVVKVSAKKWHFNYNIEEVTIEEKSMYLFDYVKVKIIDRGVIINAIIRKKYSESEEFGILRKQINSIKSDEYTEYNNFVESVKQSVKEAILL